MMLRSFLPNCINLAAFHGEDFCCSDSLKLFKALSARVRKDSIKIADSAADNGNYDDSENVNAAKSPERFILNWNPLNPSAARLHARGA